MKPIGISIVPINFDRHNNYMNGVKMRYPTDIGMLAYFDSMTGIVPCKVLRRYDDTNLEIRLTATRNVWHKGMIQIVSESFVIPRDKVRRSRKYGVLISGFEWNRN